jgi:hypothetical protein
MKLLIQFLTLTLLSFISQASISAQYALLMGISDYDDDRVPDLEGPVHDVAALRSVLIDRWQFEPENIDTLIDSQATEQAVLDAIEALYVKSEPSDDLIIYFSGHGTSASDPDLGARLNLPDGTGAIVTSDFNPDKLRLDSLSSATNDGLLIGRYELKPHLRKLDKQRNVLIIFDACFSGNAVRAVSSRYQPKQTRQLNLSALIRGLFDNNDEGDASSKLISDAPEDVQFAYNNTVYFGASAEKQLAVDFSQAEIDAGLVTSIDGKPHGGFTDSLLRVLSSTQPIVSAGHSLSFAQLFNRVVNQFNIHCDICGHTPVSLPTVDEAKHQLLNRAILHTGQLKATVPRESTESDSPFIAHLTIDPQARLDETQLSALLPARGLKSIDHSATSLPDVTLEAQARMLEARSVDGQLITRFAYDEVDAELSQWLDARQWLKHRKRNDLLNEQGLLRVEFRHPMYGNHVTQGDFIHFRLYSEIDSSLLAFVLDSRGDLSVLYPVNHRDVATQLRANTSRRIPAIDQSQIQVTPPWGTDHVLFYAIPVHHKLSAETISSVLSMANETELAYDDPRLQNLESLFNSGKLPYSSNVVRIVANPQP